MLTFTHWFVGSTHYIHDFLELYRTPYQLFAQLCIYERYEEKPNNFLIFRRHWHFIVSLDSVKVTNTAVVITNVVTDSQICGIFGKKRPNFQILFIKTFFF